MPAVEAPPAAPSSASASASIAAASRSATAMAGGTGQGSGAGKSMSDAFAALESKGTNEDGSPVAKPAAPPKPAPKPQQKAPPVAPKTEPPKPDETELTDETDQTQTETPTGTKTETAPGQPAKSRKPSDLLREEKERWQARAKELEAEVEKYKAPKEDPEKKTLSETLESERKRLSAIEEELRFTNYEKSQEYREKYQVPFEQSYNSGRSKVSALKVTDPSTGDVRPGTAADFDAIMAMQSDEAAAELIESMFGSGARAQIVTMARERVLEHFNSGEAAKAEFRKNGSEREKQQRESSEKIHKEIGSTWSESIKPEKVPDQWKPYILPKGLDGEGKPIDEEGDGLLERGYKFYDQVSTEDARNPNLTPEQRKEAIARAAYVRHRAANFPRLVSWYRKAQTEIEALKKELEQYRGSEPGPGEGDPQTETTEEGGRGTMGAALGALDKLGQPGQFH